MSAVCDVCAAPCDWQDSVLFIAPTASDRLTCAAVDVCPACVSSASLPGVMAAADRVHAAVVAAANDAVPAGKVTP